MYGKSIGVIQLASRQQLCINPEVQALKSNTLINERCLEMKKGKAKTSCCQAKETAANKNGHTSKKAKVIRTKNVSCPFYAQNAIEQVSNTAIYNTQSIIDIEELVVVAKEEKGCAYYASRNAAKDAQV